MAIENQHPHAATAADEPVPVSDNPAIVRCCNEWQRVFKELKAKRDLAPGYFCDKAFRNAMPPLSGFENIRDFIARTAHGMLIGAIRDDLGSKLLYAAQVALTMERRQPVPPKPVTAAPLPSHPPSPPISP